MKIAILGYGQQGQSAYNYWHEGNEITICDNSEALDVPAGVQTQLGTGYLQHLDQFDLLVRSPSIHPKDVAAANSPAILDKVTTVTNEFFKVCPTKHIIGVTGTKGKGTTSTLIARMLEADGKQVHLGGNIGIPPLDLLKNDIQPHDWVVLELANFQLIDLQYSPPLAVCLMVAPEHLDWHTDSKEYYAAKTQLFRHQTAGDIAIYYADNEISERIARSGGGQKIPYYAPPGATINKGSISISGHAICRTDELQLLGRHNWQNVCAAVTAVWQITQNVEALRSVLTSFTGLEHRLEFVREFKNVRYYDDSFGTTPETAIAAIEAFEQPQVIILGGRGKGASFNELAQTIKARNDYIAKVLLIGETREELTAALQAVDYDNYATTDAQTMPAIINEAAALAKSAAASHGKPIIVLLSTACTSFDMFDNYKQRGEAFKQAVQALA
jgi:UDP-N-acetylmuramoylalanine--D-glutamate ligase